MGEFSDPIPEVVAAFARGEVVILTDDEGRENEGDLVAAAELATPEVINFLVTYARGLLCVPLAPEEARRLQLAEPGGRPDPRHTAFSQSVDAIAGNTTGISAFDRSRTVRRLADPGSVLEDFYSPGHVFPLIARPGGVRERAGHTEGVVELARLAGLRPVGVLCEILNEDGTMARRAELARFKARHGLRWGTIAELRAFLEASSVPA